jgi:uncharacterized protein with HEPN domain
MDMSDPHGTSADLPEPAGAAGAETGARGDTASQWLALVSEFGADVAGPLTAALERIDSLTASGRITRADLRALREEVQQARQAGMLGQQLTILASGGLHHSPERLALDDAVRSVLARRAAELPEREIVVEPNAGEIAIVVDATLLFGLLNSLFDWAIGNSTGTCEFRTGTASTAGCVQLACTYRSAHRGAASDEPNGPQRPPRLSALAWRILEQTSSAMGLALHHSTDGPMHTLMLEFTCAPPDETALAPQPPTPDLVESGTSARPLAGSQVLVISSRRDMRVQIRDALRSMGLMIDFVSSVNEAAQFSEGGAPDAVIIESIQRGERFARFRDELSAKAPHVAFIEIVEQGRTFEKSGFGVEALGRVGRDVIDTALPAALIYELSKA